MENQKKVIKLKCVFCGTTDFELPYDGYIPQIGEMMKCSNCGKLNDFESINELAQKEGFEKIQDQLKKMLKKSGFKVK